MGKKHVINSVFAFWIALFAVSGIACELSAGQCEAAKAVAESIMAALPVDKGVQKMDCSDKSFVVTGGDDGSITSSINTAVRERRHNITIKLAPAVPLGQFPVSVADALNRVQLSGGTVHEQQSTDRESIGPLLAWAGAELGKLVTSAVNALLDAVADQWVTDNYKGYDALLLFKSSKKGGRIYKEVKLSCKK